VLILLPKTNISNIYKHFYNLKEFLEKNRMKMAGSTGWKTIGSDPTARAPQVGGRNPASTS